MNATSFNAALNHAIGCRFSPPLTPLRLNFSTPLTPLDGGPEVRFPSRESVLPVRHRVGAAKILDMGVNGGESRQSASPWNDDLRAPRAFP
jgi:hypothetical protein